MGRLRVIFTAVCLATVAGSLPDARGQFENFTVTEARCGKCGKQVSPDSKVGDRCPHCGVIWGREAPLDEKPAADVPPVSPLPGLVTLLILGLIASGLTIAYRKGWTRKRLEGPAWNRVLGSLECILGALILFIAVASLFGGVLLLTLLFLGVGAPLVLDGLSRLLVRRKRALRVPAETGSNTLEQSSIDFLRDLGGN